MPPDPSRQGYFTIPGLFRTLGYEPLPNDTWTAGNQARDAYEAVTGHLPPKALSSKTNGSGSHCFAMYPPEWRPQIESIIKRIASTRDAQGKLL